MPGNTEQTFGRQAPLNAVNYLRAVAHFGAGWRGGEKTTEQPAANLVLHS